MTATTTPPGLLAGIVATGEVYSAGDSIAFVTPVTSEGLPFPPHVTLSLLGCYVIVAGARYPAFSNHTREMGDS